MSRHDPSPPSVDWHSVVFEEQETANVTFKSALKGTAEVQKWVL